MTLVQVTYEDGTTEDVVMREAAFGLEGVAAHGPVVAARISPNNTRPGGDTIEALMGQRGRRLSYTPVYGTGRERR